MAFHFALESVLRLRVSFERQEQARLELAAQQLYAAQERCDSLKREKLELEQSFRTKIQRGAEAAEIHYYLSSQAGLKTAKTEAANALVEARKRWNEQRNKFVQARRDREVIASIRQRQLEAYQLEQSRREQQAQDDLFVMRRLQQNG